MARVKIEDLTVERTLGSEESGSLVGGGHRRPGRGGHRHPGKRDPYFGLWDPVPGAGYQEFLAGHHGGHHGGHFGGHFGGHHDVQIHFGGHHGEHH